MSEKLTVKFSQTTNFYTNKWYKTWSVLLGDCQCGHKQCAKPCDHPATGRDQWKIHHFSSNWLSAENHIMTNRSQSEREIKFVS